MPSSGPYCCKDRMMDWLTFTAALIKALAWPAVLVFFGVLLRKELRALLHRLATRLSKFKAMGFEGEFTNEVQKMVSNLPVEEQQKVEDAVPPALKGSTGDPNPVARIKHAWEMVQSALRGSLKIDERKLDVVYDPQLMIREALRQKLLTKAEYDAVVDMRSMAARATFDSYDNVDPAALTRLISTAEVIVKSINARAEVQR
jgi:hypothetical protein